MNVHHILFKTNRFNQSKVKEHLINPSCFGEDLAAWLRTKLVEKGIEAGSVCEEDWGWSLQAKYGTNSYLLGMAPNFRNS